MVRPLEGLTPRSFQCWKAPCLPTVATSKHKLRDCLTQYQITGCEPGHDKVPNEKPEFPFYTLRFGLR